MRKNIFKYALPGLLLVAMASCKKNNLVIDQDPLTPTEAARFIITPPSTTNTYFHYILSSPAPGSSYTLPIGVTTVSSSERKVKIAYSSRTAVAGAQYNAPAEVVIPANAATANLDIQGIFAGYPTGRKDTLKIKLVNADGYVKINAYQDSVMLIMQKYCDVVLANVGGDYARTFEGTYGPYLSSVIDLVSTGATTATAKITNIYDSGITINVTFDWADPAAFKVIIPDQATQYTSGGLPLRIRQNPGAATSTFSSCDNTITLNLQLYTSAGVYDQWTSSMSK